MTTAHQQYEFRKSKQNIRLNDPLSVQNYRMRMQPNTTMYATRNGGGFYYGQASEDMGINDIAYGMPNKPSDDI